MRYASINHETTIRTEGIVTTILGSTLNPLVSSSKNLNNPALDAGNGAPLLFLLLMSVFESQYMYLKTFLSLFQFFYNLNYGINRF